MKLGVIALKIRTANTRFGNRVVGAAELALAQEYTLAGETAFVIPLTEGVTKPNDNDSWVYQKVKEVVGVVCAVKNDKKTVDKLGFAAYDLHDDVRAELLRALLGWTFPGKENAALVCYNGGRIIDIRPDYMWYQYEFLFETVIDSKTDGVDDALAAQYADQFTTLFTQFKAGGDPVLPLSGPAPQLPTALLTPTVEELFQPAYAFGDAFGKDFNTLDSEVRDK